MRQVLRLAWPIVLANSAVPLLGLVDTAVIGNTGTVAELGAIALGALIFNFLYWTFAFLRMGTTGFTAQASGAGDPAEVRAALGRALLLAGGAGVLLVLLQGVIEWGALELLGAPEGVEELTGEYFRLRIWGAPAALATFGILGTFVGLGETGALLKTQLFLNGLNAGLDVLFAAVLGWGVQGIAVGTAIAEWTALGLGMLILMRLLRRLHTDAEPFWPWSRISARVDALRTLGANADIMVRTLFLLLGFAWFTDRGARFGSEILAANHILLQIVSTTAYLLDGYAHATEVLVGRAVGGGRRADFDAAVRSAGRLAAISALLLALAVLGLGPGGIALLTDLSAVRDIAGDYLPFVALYVLLSFAAFQLDGVFIGATWTRDMRNASIVSVAIFLGATWAAADYGNAGLWTAAVLWVVARAVTLGVRVPALRGRIGSAEC